MTERERDGIDFEVEEALDDRWTSEPSHLDRVLFYLVLATLGAVVLAESTGHMELVRRHMDLIALVAGVAGVVWTARDTRRGVTRFGHQGHFEVRRDEHPVGFWVLIVTYTLAFVGMAVAGLGLSLGWITL